MDINIVFSPDKGWCEALQLHAHSTEKKMNPQTTMRTRDFDIGDAEYSSALSMNALRVSGCMPPYCREPVRIDKFTCDICGLTKEWSHRRLLGTTVGCRECTTCDGRNFVKMLTGVFE